MQLTLISFQSTPDGRGEKMSLSYERFSSGRGSEEFKHAARAMLEFIRHLEDHVEAPPQWACTSHLDLMLYSRDVEAWHLASGFYTMRIEISHGAFRVLPANGESGGGTASNIVTAARFVAEVLA